MLPHLTLRRGNVVNLKRSASIVAVSIAAASSTGTAHAQAMYWNVFNIEGESSIGADLVTYSSFADMLSDANRTSVNTLSGFGAHIVGSGASLAESVAVPEPSAAALLLAGILALAIIAWRKAAAGG